MNRQCRVAAVSHFSLSELFAISWPAVILRLVAFAFTAIRVGTIVSLHSLASVAAFARRVAVGVWQTRPPISSTM
ncbi:MAG: hypothetical protein ACI8TX_000758 [Hyphomicrobiaceae bacterium]|jgi:hypothetical protein